MNSKPSSPVIGVITNSNMRVEFVRSLLQAQKLGAEIIIKASGPFLDVARNYVVETWLNEFPDSEWLIFIDDDIEFKYEDLLRLTQYPDRKVVSGIYMNPFPTGLRPVIFKWDIIPKYQQESFLAYSLEELLKEPQDEYGLINVAGVGTGCLAVHRSVYEEMKNHFEYPTPWYATTAINGIHISEDLTFCARLTYLGIDIYTDPTVRCGHVKYFKFHPDYVDDFIPDHEWVKE